MKPAARPVDRQALGRAAEDAGAVFLERAGLRILLRNFRCRLGELDLVALAGTELLIVAEVRLRSREDFGSGAASVDARKQHRLRLATAHLLQRRPHLARLVVRFDVLEVRPAEGAFAIRWIRDAFR